MILEPIYIPDAVIIDEPENVGGSAPDELALDNFDISITTVDGYPVYTITKEHTIVFTSSYCTYTFKIRTVCSTDKNKNVTINIGTYYDSKNQFAKPSTYNPSVILKAKYGNAEVDLYTYKKNTVDKTWRTKSNVFSGISLPSFYQSYTNQSNFDSWSEKINNGTYKIYGSDFSGIDGCKKIGDTWYHVSYFGENIFNNSIKIYCKEDNDINSYDRESTFTLDVPFTDCPLPVGLPVINISVLSASETSVSYKIDTDYDFPGMIAWKGLKVHKIENNSLKEVSSKTYQNGTRYLFKSDLPKTYTHNDLSLLAGETYYLCDGARVATQYDLSRRLTTVINDLTVEKIPFHIGEYDNLFTDTSYFSILDTYMIPLVTDVVQKGEDNEYYGGYGINAVPFSYAPTPITSIQLSDSITDVDLTSSSSTSFSVPLTILPSDFTRSAQPLTVKSSNSGVIGVKSNGGSSTSKIFNRTENTVVYFYARSSGTSTLTIESEKNTNISVSLTVRVHVPTSSCDPINYQIDTGVKTIIDLSYNTLSGKPTTDRILGIVEKSSHVKAAIISDTQISVIGLPYGNDWREETIKCSVGDTFNGVERINSYFNITLEVLPMPEAISFYPNTVPEMLTFDSISQMYRNLTPIMIALNSLSDDRWAEVESITKVVNVTSQYNMNFAALLTELNNLELDIKNLITPVSNYLMTKDSAYFETHTQEREIRDAISILYPQYPGQSLDSLSTASFATTLVSGSGSVNRHEFIQSRYDWCNRMIDALNI